MTMQPSSEDSPFASPRAAVLSGLVRIAATLRAAHRTSRAGAALRSSTDSADTRSPDDGSDEDLRRRALREEEIYLGWNVYGHW